MGSPKPSIRVIPTHSVNYTDREGNPQTRDFVTSPPRGRMKLHDGGSAYLGTLDIVFGIMLAGAECIVVMRKLVARIRVDGEVVLEPQLRKDDFFDDDGNAQRGALVFDFIGDETRIALAAVALKGIPELAKRAKSAKLALQKRAA